MKKSETLLERIADVVTIVLLTTIFVGTIVDGGWLIIREILR